MKSNAIIYAANQRTIGVGAGQMSRVNSARIAAIKASMRDFKSKALSWHLTLSSRSGRDR